MSLQEKGLPSNTRQGHSRISSLLLEIPFTHVRYVWFALVEQEQKLNGVRISNVGRAHIQSTEFLMKSQLCQRGSAICKTLGCKDAYMDGLQLSGVSYHFAFHVEQAKELGQLEQSGGIHPKTHSTQQDTCMHPQVVQHNV